MYQSYYVKVHSSQAIRKLAALLKHSPLAISQEIRSKGSSDGRYRAQHTQQRRHECRAGCRPRLQEALGSSWSSTCYVVACLLNRSAASLSAWLFHIFEHLRLPWNDLQSHVRLACRWTEEEVDSLGKSTRQLRRGQVDCRNQISDMASIQLRPRGGKREFPGHWEGHLTKGKDSVSAVGTLIELNMRPWKWFGLQCPIEMMLRLEAASVTWEMDERYCFYKNNINIKDLSFPFISIHINRQLTLTFYCFFKNLIYIKNVVNNSWRSLKKADINEQEPYRLDKR